MIWLVAIAPWAALIGSMILAEQRGWDFPKRLGFTALITFPTIIIAGMIMATM